jgi:hypothetical protein
MAVQKIKPGTSASVRSNEDFLSYEDDRPLMASNQWELLSHCKDKDPARAQQDDGVTGNDWPVKDSELRPKHGGPVTSVKSHK